MLEYKDLTEELNKEWQKRKNEDRATHPSFLISELLEKANKKMDGFGVESALDEERGIDIQYVNMGDAYNLTVLYDGAKDRFIVSTWGDVMEEQEREYEQRSEQGEISGKTAKQYDLGYGHMGNGLAVWNRLEEENGDYMTVAHIAPDRAVTFYDKDMPDSVKKQIEYEAQTSDRRVSATQDAPVFRTPPETKKSASLFNPEIGQRATFQPHNGKTKLTGIVKETNESEVVLQCGRVAIPALREKGTFSEAPEPDRTHTKEYAKERAQKHAGENGNVYTARGEAVYNGTILETTPTFAIQKVGEDAILHRLKDLGKADGEKSLIQPGQDVSIVKKAKGVVTAEPWDRQRKEKERGNQRRNDAHSR